MLPYELFVMRNFGTCLRQFSTKAETKTLLSKLRRRTGYAFVNCKKALEENENDFEKALMWLKQNAEKEGWAKASKLQGRKTAKGLIGMFLERNIGIMVEVNCETDFVARNVKFQNMVTTATNSIAKYCKDSLSGDQLTTVNLNIDDLNKLPWAEQEEKQLADLVSINIGSLGENMTLRRCVCYKGPSDVHLSSYIHGAVTNPQAACQLGKYASLLAFKSRTAVLDRRYSLEELGRQICQHVVGMNPTSLGSADEEPPVEGTEDDESRMWFQEFLLDPQVTVGDVLTQNGLEVLDFTRFECGETLETES